MILDYDKKAIDDIYNDYIGLGGNSYVKGLYENEVKHWKLVESWDEIWKKFPDDPRNPNKK